MKFNSNPTSSSSYLSILFLFLSFSNLSVLAAPILGRNVYSRSLPTPISVSTAKTQLSELRVAADSNSPLYDRNRFKTWDIISGNCDTRETVLKRDGTSVVTDTACRATSGHWVSAYDNVATNLASDLDIDHVIPLKEAWISGARDWTDAQREAFANDLTRPQLIAVTDNLNQSKGDRDIANWIPPAGGFVCIYARAWVQVKHFYGLTIDSAEKSAITNILNGC